MCSNQIVVCLKFLEKTVNKEAEIGCLITARQCFFERILWCLARLKSTVKSANDHVLTGIREPEDFVSLLDHTLDVLSSFIGLDESNSVANRAEQRAELMMESREVRESIELLLSHAMTFSNVALDSDKNPIKELSQNVLKVAMEFEEEFSLAVPGKKFDISAQQMKAMELENSLFSLEKFVNNALLRLVFEVFHVIDEDLIKKLLKIEGASALEDEIETFDLLVDRLIQIGHFAIRFSQNDVKVSSVIRSCLASIESLDSYLIPAINSKSDPSIEVLQDLFDSEAKLLLYHIQQIIDTEAFCSILMEKLNDDIETNRKSYNKVSLSNLVQRSNVLLDHFQINSKSLQIMNDKEAKFYFSDFKLILTECDAILNFPESIEDEERRVLKRFSILSSTTGKLRNAINNQTSFTSDDKGNVKEVISRVAEFPSKCSDVFNSIRPQHLNSILYESKRSFKYQPRALNASKVSFNTLRKSSKKRNSLRIAIFKRNANFEPEETWNDNESLDLQITEILDKLTDLSLSQNAH